MLHQLIKHIVKMCQRAVKPQSYSSELESYILSHQPQSIYDVEQLTRRFDKQLSQGRIL
jgi:hypothetical protein